MRVNEAASGGRSVPAEQGWFGEALRRARHDVAARGGMAVRAPGRLEPRRELVQARASARRDASREEERTGGAGDPGRAGMPPEITVVPEIGALVRMLPAAIQAARARDGTPLELSFGSSLQVELRSGAAGVEVLLRPEPRLLRAAHAELPRVLEVLRLRGIAVARAEVLARRGGGTRRAR